MKRRPAGHDPDTKPETRVARSRRRTESGTSGFLCGEPGRCSRNARLLARRVMASFWFVRTALTGPACVSGPASVIGTEQDGRDSPVAGTTSAGDIPHGKSASERAHDMVWTT